MNILKLEQNNEYLKVVVLFSRLNELESTKTIKKRFSDGISVDDIDKYRKTMDAKYLNDIFKNHLFFFYISTIRSLGYNEYRMKSGELLTVDLDRASFTMFERVKMNSLSLCYICKVDLKTLENLQDALEEKSLETTIQHSLLYDQFQITFSASESKILRNRIKDSLDCIERCISKHGYKDVILL